MNTTRTMAAVVAGAMALFFTSCGRENAGAPVHDHADAGHAHEIDPGISYDAKSGLLVQPETAAFIGLEVADVEERAVASQWHFTASVYRAAKEARLASTQPMTATTTLASAALDSAKAAVLHEGQRVTVEAEGLGTLEGRILEVHHNAAHASGQTEILLAVADTQARLDKGTFLTVNAPLQGAGPVMSVPCSALLRTTEGHFVYTVSGDRFVRAPIKVGLVNHAFAEVTDGLYAGDRIVVKPVMTLWLAELQSLRGGKACADGH